MVDPDSEVKVVEYAGFCRDVVRQVVEIDITVVSSFTQNR